MGSVEQVLLVWSLLMSRMLISLVDCSIVETRVPDSSTKDDRERPISSTPPRSETNRLLREAPDENQISAVERLRSAAKAYSSSI
jgi:hypothetical protein